MINDLGCDLLVAKYALMTVEYKSVEDALEVIFGAPEDEGTVTHPFFGYSPAGYIHPANAADNELGGSENVDDALQRCFVCEKPESSHQKDYLRQFLDEQEKTMINSLPQNEYHPGMP